MARRNVITILATLCWTGVVLGGAAADVHLHLPRNVSVSNETFTLGEIAVVRSPDDELERKMSSIVMGRTPQSGEKTVIDRRTIRSRLAANRISASRVRLTGAEKVTVTCNESLINARRLIDAAEQFLAARRPGPSGCSWRLVRKPRDLAVYPAKDIQLRCRLAKSAPRGYVTVDVVAFSGERELAATMLLFKLAYPVPQAVAVKDIAAGEMLTQANTQVRVVNVEREASADWSPPYGMVATRAIPAGRIISPGLIRKEKPEVVVQRNHTVQMKIEAPGFTITGLGLALQDGRPGEMIKVRNADSKRIVTAKVAADGTVWPIYEKR